MGDLVAFFRPGADPGRGGLGNNRRGSRQNEALNAQFLQNRQGIGLQRQIQQRVLKQSQRGWTHPLAGDDQIRRKGLLAAEKIFRQ